MLRAAFTTKSVAITRWLILGLLMTATLLTPAAARAQGTTYDWDDPNSNRDTRMWVPEGLTTIRGILIIGNGAGGDSRNQTSLAHNRLFAEQFGFAVIGTEGWGNFSGGTAEISVWNQQLADLAVTSGHAELVNAPWAPIGLSNGGQMSYGFNYHHPEKTIAFIANKGAFYTGTYPANGHASLMNPGILIAGENDTSTRRTNIKGIFDNNRPRPALWAWVEQENTGHSKLANDLVMPFMAEAIRLRYPSNQAPTGSSGVTLTPLTESGGWLADNASWAAGLTTIDAYADYAGTKSTASWLMNENMAFLFRGFASYNKDVSFDLPNIEVFYSHDNQLSFTDPLAFELTVDTSNVPDWSKVELFNYADKLLTLTSTGSPQNEAVFDVVLPGAGVYGLVALVTHADGTTISTTDVKAFIAIPEPVTAALLGGGSLLLAGRRPRRDAALA